MRDNDAGRSKAFNEFKVRLLFAMMFYSFEIQNDMPLSVTIYSLLEAAANETLEWPIRQNWISNGYLLDRQRISSFGSCKIQEAQIVRDFDQTSNALKQQEVQQMKKGTAVANAAAAAGKYRPECMKYAKFYLEQLFHYLTLALTSESNSGAIGVAFSSNEEKINEMWDKLCYSLSRAETSDMIGLVQYVFCTLAAFQVLHKTFFDGFVLRKFDFEKLLKSVCERLKAILSDLQANVEVPQRRKLQSILQRGDAESLLL